MKRILIALSVVALGVAMATPATAGVDCDRKPNHPTCQDGEPAEELPRGGTMCDPDEYPKNPDDGTFQIEGVQSGDFTFTLAGKKPGTCIDVMSIAGPWEVTVTGEGARYLGLIPRDSIAAGDSCGGPLLRNAANIYGASPHILGYNGSIPAATINACGTEWAEWVDVDWPGLDADLVADGGDCTAYSDDGSQCLVAGEPKDENGDPIAHPLILQVLMQSGGGSTTFYVDLPPLDPDWPDLEDEVS